MNNPAQQEEKSKQYKANEHITAHIINPSGKIEEHKVKDHLRWQYDDGVYDVANTFTLPNGKRMMLVSKGNPVPQPSNGRSDKTAMNDQYKSATIRDLSRIPGPGGEEFFDKIISKLSRIPAWVGVVIIVIVVLVSQGVI